MGCVPQKNENRYQELVPQKKKIIDRFYEENPDNDSLALLSNLKAPRQGKDYGRKRAEAARRKSSTSSKMRKRSGSKPKIFSQEKRYQQNDKSHMYAQKNKVNKQRNPGKVIEIPFRPHNITKIQTPSESFNSSNMSKLENHPSLFFLKLNSEIKEADKSPRSPKKKLSSLIPVSQDVI